MHDTSWLWHCNSLEIADLVDHQTLHVNEGAKLARAAHAPCPVVGAVRCESNVLLDALLYGGDAVEQIALPTSPSRRRQIQLRMLN